MSLWRRLTGGLRALRNREATDRDIDAEVEHYYVETVSSLVASGMSPAEARRTARLELGDALSVREDVRAYGWEHVAGTLGTDIRYAARRLRMSPGFTAAAVLTLALGIGASTAIFSAVRPVLFEALPYPDARRLVMVWDRGADGTRLDVTFGTYRELLARSRSFESLAVTRVWQPTLTGTGAPERFDGQRVSASYFRTLGVAPALGREFDEAEDQVNGPRVVILGDALWRQRFAADTSIIGREILLNDAPYTVVGVMPRTFENVLFPSAALWAPLQYDPALPVDGREWGHHLHMLGRLETRVDAGAAMRELTRVALNPVPDFARVPWAALEQGLAVESLHESVTRDVKPALLALLGAALLLLGIACGNVTNLLLARAAQRRSELALRAVLGAGRTRIVTQLLVESLLLAFLGGAAGVALADVALRALLALSPSELPRMHAIRLDHDVLLFTLGLTTVIGVAMVVLPALLASGRSAGVVVQQSSRRVTRGDRSARRALVVAEVVLAAVLLVNAALLVRSLDRLLAVDPGFDGGKVVTMQVQTVGRRFDDDTVTRQFFADVLEAVRAVPGVEHAGFTSQLPLSGDLQKYGVHFEARPVLNPEEDGSALRYAVTPGYFEAMRIPLRRGRLLDERDRASSEGAVVINESLAARIFPGADPVGQRMRIGSADQPWSTVVGVVADVKHSSLEVRVEDAVYLPAVQGYFTDRALWLVVRARGDAAALAPALRRAIWSVDDDQPIVRVATMHSLLAAATAQRRFTLVVFQVFALTALLLAAVGLYGILAGGVTERTRELGVRAALGATGAGILSLVLREGLGLTALGIAIGLALAASASRLIASLLYGVSQLDPLTYIAVPALLITMAAVASWLPARRAARVDPASALRAE